MKFPSFLKFLWQIIEIILAPFMWITDHFPTIEGTAAFLAKPLIALSDLLEPVLAMLPDSPFMPAIAAAVLAVLFILLKRQRDDINAENADGYIQRNLSWICAALLLGMMFASGGHELSSSTFVCYSPIPLTLHNISEWDGFEQVILLLTLLGTLILSLMHVLTKGIRSLIRTWVGMGLCVASGYVLMQLRFWFISNVMGGLINLVFNLGELLLCLGVFFGFIVMILPTNVIHAMNEHNEEQRKAPSPDDDDDAATVESEPKIRKIPSYVADEDGNTYPVEIRGDFLYIMGRESEISIKWEYVMNDRYFYIDGVRFYPHF